MAFSGLDPNLLGQLERSSASPIQTYLLQRVIRAVEPNALLSQHASSLAGMAAELPRAQSALRSHGETLQPRESLLSYSCKYAGDSVARTLRFRPQDQLLQDVKNTLDRVPNAVIGASTSTQRRSQAIVIAHDLENLSQGIPRLICEMFSHAWSSTGQDNEDWLLLDHIADEMACLVASTDRDPGLLESNLTTSIRYENLNVQK